MNTAQKETYGYNTDEKVVLRVRAMEAFESMCEIARQKGYMSDEGIETVINKSRQERKIAS